MMVRSISFFILFLFYCNMFYGQVSNLSIRYTNNQAGSPISYPLDGILDLNGSGYAVDFARKVGNTFHLGISFSGGKFYDIDFDRKRSFFQGKIFSDIYFLKIPLSIGGVELNPFGGLGVGLAAINSIGNNKRNNELNISSNLGLEIGVNQKISTVLKASYNLNGHRNYRVYSIGFRFNGLNEFRRDSTNVESKWKLGISYSNNLQGSFFVGPFDEFGQVDGSSVSLELSKRMSGRFGGKLSLGLGNIYDSGITYSFSSLDLIPQYYFLSTKISEKAILEAFIGLGMGLTSIDTDGVFGEDSNYNLLTQGGLELEMSRGVVIETKATYNTSSVINFRSYAVGFKLPLFGGKDSDGDGIKNREDNCPNVIGSVINQGCPLEDSDRDGVPDINDQCPNQYGETDDGCPLNNEDEPNIDTDNDGIRDIDDKCPNKAGSISNEGCPTKEIDEKELISIEPEDLQITDTSAVKINNRIVLEEINSAQNIYQLPDSVFLFGYGSSSLSIKSKELAQFIFELMNEDESFKIYLQSWGDANKSFDENLGLANKRLITVSNYLIDRGISKYRIISDSYGTSDSSRKVVVRIIN